MDLYSLKSLFTSVVAVTLLFCVIDYTKSDHTKRSLAFTSGSSFGYDKPHFYNFTKYLAAVAIPIEIPNRNLYVAFNLETNYGLPPNDTHYNLIEKWNLTGMFSDVGNNMTRIEGGGRNHRSLYTRKSFYQSVFGYFEFFGMNGTQCLLRTICEVAESKLYSSNGVLGSIIHVLFMPTSSLEENVATSIYEAEKHGHEFKCHLYESGCPEGLLNKISISL